ncbi:hypothetical protein LTR37_008793 [Vermiconidia calcicola]|uniref:Uncharacterized protein n=1 Tax=Vermiconidia calcicola TaxID=1690605 RepID=A0ACC3NCD4_9PEZI|nr:hypothetical protein LTR37_008793 [Vermiconidia calcicola]
MWRIFSQTTRTLPSSITSSNANQPTQNRSIRNRRPSNSDKERPGKVDTIPIPEYKSTDSMKGTDFIQRLQSLNPAQELNRKAVDDALTDAIINVIGSKRFSRAKNRRPQRRTSEGDTDYFEVERLKRKVAESWEAEKQARATAVAEEARKRD